VWIGPLVTYGFGAGFEWGVATGFMFGFAADALWYPWWEPVGWGWGWGDRHVPVGFYHHGNVYTRWGGRAVVNHVRNTFVGRVGNTRVVQNSRMGDLYAGHERNVYRFQHG